MKKIGTFLLTIVLLSTSSVYALTKDETVYTKLNSDGSVKETIVSDILKNNNLDVIEDESNLKEILNINGEEKFKSEGTSLKWEAKKKDIYYQGKTDKELPISLKVTYYLDDKEISLKDLLGKKGKVTIDLKYTNLDEHIVNGEVLYTPFVVTTGTIVSNKNNKNITVSNGKVVSNGTNSIILAIASPGLSESLNMDSLKKFDEIRIEYETTKFELNSIYSVITSKLIDEEDSEIFNKLDDISDKLTLLNQSSSKLVNGSKELLAGADKLKEGSKKLSEGLNQAYLGSSQINSVLSSSINSLENMTLDPGTEQKMLTSINNTLKNSGKDINLETINGIKAQEQEIKSRTLENLKTNETYINYSNLVKEAENNGILELISSCETINETNMDICTSNATNITNYKMAKQVITLMESVATETAYNTALTIAPEVANNTVKGITSGMSGEVLKNILGETKNNLIGSLKELNYGINSLTTGLNELNNGSKELDKGIDTLANGTKELATGLETFDREGIKQIINLVDSTKIRNLFNLGKEYDTFTMKGNNTNGNVKFVLVIDGEKESSKKNEK